MGTVAKSIFWIVVSKFISYGFIAFVLYDANWLLNIKGEDAGWAALRGWALSTGLVYLYRLYQEREAKE